MGILSEKKNTQVYVLFIQVTYTPVLLVETLLYLHLLIRNQINDLNKFKEMINPFTSSYYVYLVYLPMLDAYVTL